MSTLATRETELTPPPANPTLLGLVGFLIPYTSTILILCGFQGAVAPQSLVGLSGDYYFFGAIAMNIAGIAEFILGNSKCLQLFLLFLQDIIVTDSIQRFPWPSSSSTAATGRAWRTHKIRSTKLQPPLLSSGVPMALLITRLRGSITFRCKCSHINLVSVQHLTVVIQGHC